MHSVLLMRGEQLFGEFYWKPFHSEFCHRMYSQTKSYVSVAIGLLEEDGFLSLDDRICDHFPEKIEREKPEYLSQLTVRQMLNMQTCGVTPSWFSNQDADRAHLYFNQSESEVPGGMRWRYDSPGTQVLSTLVEKRSGKSLFDFLNERIFCHLGTFQTATILKTKTEDSFGDSALLCTPRDMVSFARFVMNYGTWQGKQLMNEAYLRTATSPLVDNDITGFAGFATRGYGYQFWCLGKEAFFFSGMGCQLTFCYPKFDLIFSVTGDNQGFPDAKSLIFTAFQDEILDHLQDHSLPEDPVAYEECLRTGESLKLCVLPGETYSPVMDQINHKTFLCGENPMGITKFSLHFNTNGEGEWHYTNAQGDKVLPFGLGKNVFGKFPQLGYSDLHAGSPTHNGHRYDCAASAAWREEGKMQLKVQIIDKYFGNMLATFSFRGKTSVLKMKRNAEAFLKEYEGVAVATLSES